jgi:hypothetical protein
VSTGTPIVNGMLQGLNAKQTQFGLVRGVTVNMGELVKSLFKDIFLGFKGEAS